MIVALTDVKNFLRLDSDITNDDALLQVLIDSAAAYITNATGYTFDSTYPLAQTISYMLISQWYTNRETAGQVSQGTQSILNGLLTQLAASYDVYIVSVPSGLTATVYTGYVWLRWLANLEPNVDGYNVYRGGVKLNTDDLVRWSSENEDEFMLVSREFVQTSPDTPENVVSYKDSTVVSGQSYQYQVTAVDMLGNETAKSPIVTVIAQ